MKNICAWCEKDLGEYPGEATLSNHQITHGICEECKTYFFTEHTYTLESFLNKLQDPVLLINEDAEVLLANGPALQMVKKDLVEVRNLRIGNVMECAHARLPGGCGSSVHCLACTIRFNINNTFKTGKSLKRVPAFLSHREDNNIQHADYLVSTEKVGAVVLLRIDEVIKRKARATVQLSF